MNKLWDVCEGFHPSLYQGVQKVFEKFPAQGEKSSNLS